MADRFDELVAFVLGPRPDDEDDEPQPRPCYHCGTPGIDMRQGKDCCADCAKDLDAQQDEIDRERAGDWRAK